MTLHEIKLIESFQAMTPSMQRAVELGYDLGYEEGFQTAVIAERGIMKIQADPITPDSSEDSAKPQQSGGAASLNPVVSELQKSICGGLKR